MKKIIKKKDGSVVEIDGTPEEIAEYERKLRGEVKEQPSKKGPELLKDQVSRSETNQKQIEHSSACQLVIAQRGWWSVVPPSCTCGLLRYCFDVNTSSTGTSTGNSLWYPPVRAKDEDD